MTDFMDTEDRRESIKQKLRQNFDGKIVRKDLTKKIKEGANVPVYVLEFLSDILQIGYFKATHGKRIFKMAPIHHHFEMCGWKEKKIVAVFTLVNLLGCAVGLALFYYGVIGQ